MLFLVVLSKVDLFNLIYTKLVSKWRLLKMASLQNVTSLTCVLIIDTIFTRRSRLDQFGEEIKFVNFSNVSSLLIKGI